MTETTAGPTKKDVLAAFGAIEVSTIPISKAEAIRQERAAGVEAAIAELRDILVEAGIADGDLAKATRTASSLSSLLKNATATIASIPDNVLDPSAEAPKPKAPRKSTTKTLNETDAAAAVERAEQPSAAVVMAAPGAIDPEAPTAEQINEAADVTPEQPTRDEEPEGHVEEQAKEAPQQHRSGPPRSGPSQAAPSTDPRGDEDPNAGDGF